MADAALFGIAKSVLQQLASPAMDELKLLWNHSTQLENLRETMTTISTVLEDAERQQATNRVVELWLERLKSALYDADDFFDIAAAKALHYKAKYGSSRKGIKQLARLPFSRMYHFAFMVESAHKVKEIRERMDAISKDIRDFGFLVRTNEQDERERTRRGTTHSYVRSDEVVGREKEREEIVRLLLTPPHAEQEGVSVIAVIGFGGMGKTTLAKLVYGDDKFQLDFDLLMWACIKDFSCLDQVLVTLVESITKSKVEEMSTENLQFKLRKEIEGKRFLLVLDDVWDENPLNWRDLKILLDSGKPGSMVLATTRSVKVAQSLSAIEPYYYLQGMSDESAWILFEKIAFGGKQQQQRKNSGLEGLGQQIVKKCANVPLLIVTIASFLSHQEESKWRSLVNGEFPTVVPGDYTKFMQVLKISYKEFPFTVKRCFAFCSLFPKGYDFNKDKLIRLWIAEGFVEANDVDESLEDKAEEYLLYLVDICFFQKVIGYDDTTYNFQMHDVVHDLAKEVAGSESVSIDDLSDKKLTRVDNAVRHVSLLDCDWSSFLPPKCKVRTFLRFGCEYDGASNRLNQLISNFKALRVLDLSNMGIKEVPSAIGKLTHLRFLNLSWNEMKSLPSSICNLHHLQSLILEDCNNLMELPEDTGRLISMRHLLLRHSLFVMPAGLAALTSLVTLNKRVVHKPGGELRYLERLNNLSGSLSIFFHGIGWEDVIKDAQRASLSRKSRLKELIFDFCEVESGGQVDELMAALEPHPNLEHLVIELFRGRKMPQWISSLNRLVGIKLSWCNEVVELPPLSHIQSLKELYLENMSSLIAIEGNTSYDPEFPFFPSLKTLSLSDLPNLRGWWVQEPVVLPKFPHVTIVSIVGCKRLEIACMPVFEPIVEDLELCNVQEEVVLGIMNEFSSSSALKLLVIGYIEGLTRMRGVESLSGLRELKIPKVTRAAFEGLKLLTSLETLTITGFVDDVVEERGGATPWEFLQRLQTLNLSFGESFSTRGVLDGLEYLTNSLQHLTLSNCRDLYLPWTSLLSLRHLLSLEIINVKKVIDVVSTAAAPMDIPQQQQPINTSIKCMLIHGGSAEWVHNMPWMSFPSLQSLTLSNISNMDLEALPEGIQHLSSLQSLYLNNLKRVTSLPYCFSSLSSLRCLYISSCSEELNERCKEPTGEDWPLIQHVEFIDIR